MSHVPEPLITTSPGRLSGTPVFAGTRVPVQTLIDDLENGESLEAFLSDFPSVSREHAIAVLELAKAVLLAKAVVSLYPAPAGAVSRAAFRPAARPHRSARRGGGGEVSRARQRTER